MSWKIILKDDEGESDAEDGDEGGYYRFTTDLTPKEMESLHELGKQIEETIYTMKARLGFQLWDDSAQHSWQVLNKIQNDLKRKMDVYWQVKFQ